MDQYGFHFSICSMKFYCSSIHPPPPSLSLFSFLLARFPPRANLVTRIHSKRNYPMQRKLQVYVCIRVAGTEGRGPIGCAGLSKTSNNKTFLRFPKPIRHRRHHLPHSTYQSRRRSTISIPPSIANRLHSRNLNSQLLQFFSPAFAKRMRSLDPRRSTPTSTPRVRSSRFLGI